MKKVVALLLTFSAAALLAAKSAKDYVNDLSSDDTKVVMEAVKWVGENKEKSAVQSLVNILKSSSDSEVKSEAACSLGLIGEKAAVKDLSEVILSENDSDVRYSIVLAVARIGIDSRTSYDNLVKAKDKETDPFIKDFIAKMEEKFAKSN